MDSDRIDIAGIAVKMLEQTIEEQKQILSHLHKHVKDVKERNYLIEMNEECERIIVEKENQLKEVSKSQKKFVECKEDFTVMERKS